VLKEIANVEKIANASKAEKLFKLGVKYIYAMGFAKLIYPITKRGAKKTCKTFFGESMQVILPAGTDIYLAGGKTHDSEIRLAKFLIINLHCGDVVIDVGAHFGYFSLLASKLVENEGRVFSFEPSNIFFLLKENAEGKENIRSFKKAITDANSEIEFYEFPELYSEFNTTNSDQFKKESWIKKYAPKQIKISSITLDLFIKEQNIHPSIIKIDVEGAELKALKGAETTLRQLSPIVVMEFLHHERSGDIYTQAHNLMIESGYASNVINGDGHLQPVHNVDEYLAANNLESENVVYTK